MSSTDNRTTDLVPPPDLDPGRGLPSHDRGLDPVIAAARTAGRLAGERLAHTPLTPRQRAAVASLMGGGRR